ncbi:IclR family transcriptional regulator [Pseudomonas sp. Marseille-QA0892]
MTEHNNNAPAGAQALFRGLAVIEAVAGGARSLQRIGEAIGCTRSTTHRLVSALSQAGYLRNLDGEYVLGARLIELGFRAQAQLPLVDLARPHLRALSNHCGDTVHLGVREHDDVFYLDKMSGGRGLEMRSRIGMRMPLALTGVGKALMLDLGESEWARLYDAGVSRRSGPGLRDEFTPWADYLSQMKRYAQGGYSLDLEENELGIRCVAAPIRDASGAIVAALSVASAITYMPEPRLEELRPAVIETAGVISRELGWRPS